MTGKQKAQAVEDTLLALVHYESSGAYPGCGRPNTPPLDARDPRPTYVTCKACLRSANLPHKDIEAGIEP